MASVKLLARDLESLNRLVEPPPAVTERIPLKKYYESAETLLLHAENARMSGELEKQYILLMRFARFIVEAVNKHPEYNDPQHRLMRMEFRQKAHDAMTAIDALKPKLTAEYAAVVAREKAGKLREEEEQKKREAEELRQRQLQEEQLRLRAEAERQRAAQVAQLPPPDFLSGGIAAGAAPGMSVGVGAAPVFKSSLFMPISPGIAPSSPDSSAAMFANLPNQSILNLVDVDSPKPAHASPVTIPSSLSGLQFGAADPPKPTAQDVKMPTPSAPPAASSPSPAGSNSSAPRPAASAAELLYRSPPNNHLNHSPATEESPKVVRAVVTTTHHAPLLPPSVVVHKEQPRISPSNSNDKLGSGSGSPIVPPPNSSSPTTSSKTDAAPLIPLPSSKRSKLTTSGPQPPLPQASLLDSPLPNSPPSVAAAKMDTPISKKKVTAYVPLEEAPPSHVNGSAVAAGPLVSMKKTYEVPPRPATEKPPKPAVRAVELPPAYKPSLTIPDFTVGKHICGFENLGNTCWMNSILQTLTNTPPVVSYFLSGDYKEDVTSQRTFAEEFARLLKSLWAHQTPHMTDLAPIDLLQAFRALVPSLSQHMRQQDAHEGLTYMLDLIHDSINKAKSKTYHEEGSQSSSQALLDRKRRDDSFIWDMFGGQLQSKLVCFRCNHKSFTFDNFTHLSLELPSLQSATLQSCLQTFTTLEQVEWDCPSCKHRSVPNRKLQVSSLPKILVLHLKRFRQLLTGETRKIETFVKFPVENLDLDEFSSYKTRNPVRSYNLYAVINQRGSLSSGHYTAFVKRKGRWFFCNDSQISSVVDASAVVTSDAYLLFYYRVDLRNVFE